MTGLIAGGVAAAIAAIAIWIAVARAKQSGASDQAAKDVAMACEVDAATLEIEAEKIAK
jgi:hypothetical protein